MKEQILKQATTLFAIQGFNGTSLQSISDAVGIQKASLLYHFPTKAALREAVLDALLAHWKDVLPRVLLVASAGENRVDAIFAEVFSFFRADPNRARLLMREILDAPEVMQARLAEHLAPWMSLVTDAIQRGQKEGHVYQALDPDAFVALLMVAIIGSFSAGEVAGGVMGVEEGGVDRGLTELVRIAKTSLLRPSSVE